MVKHAIDFCLVLVFAGSLCSFCGCGESAKVQPAANTRPEKAVEEKSVTSAKQDLKQDQPPEEATPATFESPEECFKQFAKVRGSNDPALGLPFFTEAFQSFMAGQQAYAVEREVMFQTDKAKACEAILKKYNHDKTDIIGLLQLYDSPGRPGAQVAFVRVGNSIKDKATFFKDARIALSDSEDQAGEEKSTDKSQDLEQPQLKDVQIDGDWATGTIVDSGEKSEITFRRVDGSWKIALDRKEDNWLKDQK